MFSKQFRAYKLRITDSKTLRFTGRQLQLNLAKP